MSNDISNIETELNEAFDDLSLVNCTDLDVYLKVIMLSDEKTAQSIRGDINHLMQKYIAANPELKYKLKKSDYISFNCTYLNDSYNKVRNTKIEYYESKIQNVFHDAFKNPVFIETFTNYYKMVMSHLPSRIRLGRSLPAHSVNNIFSLKMHNFKPNVEITYYFCRNPIYGEIPGSIIGFYMQYAYEPIDHEILTCGCCHYVKIYYPPDPELIKNMIEHYNLQYSDYTVEASLKAIQMRNQQDDSSLKK